MSLETIRLQPRRLSDTTFPEIEKYLLKTPSLIFPVGSFEPLSGKLPIGILSRCCEELAFLLSRKTDIMVAPLFQYGFGTPFKAFGGCSGVSLRTFANSLIECCDGWFFQGFRRILLLTLEMEVEEVTVEAVKQINQSNKTGCEAALCALQKNEQFREYCARKCNVKESARSEWGDIALVRHFFSVCFTQGESLSETFPVPDRKSFLQWRKRGRDPQKLRKMTPVMRLSEFDGSVSADEAEELAEFTLSLLYSRYVKFLSEF